MFLTPLPNRRPRLQLEKRTLSGFIFLNPHMRLPLFQRARPSLLHANWTLIFRLVQRTLRIRTLTMIPPSNLQNPNDETPFSISMGNSPQALGAVKSLAQPSSQTWSFGGFRNGGRGIERQRDIGAKLARQAQDLPVRKDTQHGGTQPKKSCKSSRIYPFSHVSLLSLSHIRTSLGSCLTTPSSLSTSYLHYSVSTSFSLSYSRYTTTSIAKGTGFRKIYWLKWRRVQRTTWRTGAVGKVGKDYQHWRPSATIGSDA